MECPVLIESVESSVESRSEAIVVSEAREEEEKAVSRESASAAAGE